MTDSLLLLAPGQRVLDANGDPVPNGTLKYFEATTTTPRTVYSDSGLTVELGTTVYTDAGGYPVSGLGSSTKVQIYTGTGAYKVTIANEAAATLVTHDNVPGALDTSTFAPEVAKAKEPVLSVTNSRAVVTTDYGKLLEANSTGGSITLTLPAAATAGDGTRIRVRHVGTAGTVSIPTTGGELISGPQGSSTSYQLTSFGNEVLLICTGAGWTASALYIPDGSITAAQLASSISGTFVQTGAISIWPVDGALPTGYLDCDGSAVSRTTYSELFAVYAEKYGAGDGSTTFNLPNYSGEFLRGWDNGAGVDGDAASRTDRGDGTTGDAVGTRQGSRNKAHTHGATGLTASIASNSPIALTYLGVTSNVTVDRNLDGSSATTSFVNTSTSTSPGGVHGHVATMGGSTASDGGTDGRPLNVGVRFICFAGGSAATGASSVLNTILHGSGDPNDVIGNDDDFYIDVDAWRVWGPKAAGTWVGTGYRFALTSLGSWATTTEYIVNDFVVNGTSSYVCILDHTAGATDDEPGVGATTATYWTLLASGTAGANGSDGTDPGFKYNFDTSTTTAADPGTADLRLNNATLASVTEISISYLSGETGNPSIEGYIKSWDDSTTTADRGKILITNIATPENYFVGRITSAITDGTTYGRFTLEHVVSAGTLTGALSVQFYQTGDVGASGAGTGDVVAANNLSEYTATAATARANISAGDMLASNNLSDLANAGTARTNLALVPGTDVQAYDASLQSISGVTTAADEMLYTTSSDTFDKTSITAFGRSLIDDAAAVNARTTLGVSIGGDVQAFGAVLDDLNTLGANSADGEFLVGTGAGALAWESGATARTSLGLAIGADVQAYDADLAALAGLTSAADALPYFTGSGTADVTTVTAFARSILDDADEATFKATVNLQIGTDVQGYNSDLQGINDATFAQGDILYHNGTTLVNLSPGSSGQFLKSQGAAANVVWDTIGGGGDLLASNNLSDVANATTSRTNIGAGDVLASNNLNDVASAATAFANIKQAASATATGVVELATSAEAETGTDTTRAVTPAGVKASITENESFTPFASRAKAVRTTAGSFSTATTTVIDFDSEDFDTDSYLDLGTDADRFTIPSGVASVVINGYLQVTTAVGSGNYVLIDHLNSAGVRQGFTLFPMIRAYVGFATGLFAVSAGDYFEMSLYQDSGVSASLHTDGRNYMSIAAVA